MQKKKKESSFLLVILLAAIFVRLLFNILIVGIDRPIGGDEPIYDQCALNILRGNGFATELDMLRPPLYPLFLSVIYWIFGHSYLAVRVIQCIIGGLSCILIYYIGAKIFGEHIGKISAIIATFYPPLIYFSPILHTETLFIFLLLLSIFSLIMLKERGSVLSMMLCGIVLGSTALTKPNATIFFPFVLIWMLLNFKESITKVVIQSVAVFAFCLVIIGSWTVRNYLVFRSIVPISLTGGCAFWGSNNGIVLNHPEAWGRWIKPSELPFYEDIKCLDQVQRDRRYWQLGMNFLKNNPEKIPKLLWHKFLRFWNPFPHLTKRDKIIVLLTYGALLPFMAYGLALSFWKEEKPLLLYFVILAFMLSTLIFWGGGRMRVPISPYLIMFASCGLDTLFQRGYRFLRHKTLQISMNQKMAPK